MAEMRRPLTRIDRVFAELAARNCAAFITFVTAGDPDLATSARILDGLPDAGADLIELGMPFTDPMADGPAIQAASLRALKAGTTLKLTLDLVRLFRIKNDSTPIVLMGYYNPIYSYGVERFIADALQVGVDGLIVVDLPPEEDNELCLPVLKAGLSFVRLATPTTDDRRLKRVLTNTSGFVYYVSITGITGAASANPAIVAREVARLRRQTDLPIAVGFGVRTADQAAAVARVADATVIGSALVTKVAEGLDSSGAPRPHLIGDMLGFVRELADSVHRARL